ncbi:MAG TPA: ricin-type beta-trefoil lectin domain protein [Longimicrobiaceae bacterium]|nr:ricin-type beta-trefoil lectin domain protein [Longimicrobiaceae bacterium]
MHSTRRSRSFPLWLGVLLAAAAFVGLPGGAQAQYYMFESYAYPGKCMDVYRGDLSDGNHIDVYSCQSSVNQYFQRLSDGHVVVQKGQTGPRGYQMCMDYYPTAGRIGDPVKIWPCRPLTGPGDSQHWYFLGSNQWMGGSGNCVSAPSGTNGTQLVMAACNPSNPPANTRWRPRT